jgi:hypothetical protein
VPDPHLAFARLTCKSQVPGPFSLFLSLSLPPSLSPLPLLSLLLYRAADKRHICYGNERKKRSVRHTAAPFALQAILFGPIETLCTHPRMFVCVSTFACRKRHEGERRIRKCTRLAPPMEKAGVNKVLQRSTRTKAPT